MSTDCNILDLDTRICRAGQQGKITPAVAVFSFSYCQIFSCVLRLIIIKPHISSYISKAIKRWRLISVIKESSSFNKTLLFLKNKTSAPANQTFTSISSITVVPVTLNYHPRENCVFLEIETNQ